ncbi:hypothetical protein [Streptomyces sp. SID13031]|uniref:DUF6985 domain-containing protein n=1 Tax=Streptomyces sp. SID13031 TaxID=2706046 RepID=UPI0013C8119B|nr:hypothetical protein [Streptomyces sp. SID13031]NEA32735.1 hypothetical protein [Streptomyces sp. SID13031]
MEIPGLGAVVEDDAFEGYRSKAVPVGVLGGLECEFVVQGYDEEEDQEDFHAAIRTFLSLGPSALTEAAPAVYAYYLRARREPGGDLGVKINGPDDVLEYVNLGTEAEVLRNDDGDGRIYVSLECGCDWEPEQGLQLVFRDGACVTRVGPYDGELTD